MKTIEIQLYKFEELTSEAQQNAINKWRESDEYVFGKENEQSLNAFCNCFPVKVTNWSYDAYSHNERFLYAGDRDYQLLSGKRLISYLLSCNWPDLYQHKTFTLKSGKKRTSRVIIEETCCPFTGYYIDEALLQPIRDYIKRPNSMDFEELLEECVRQWGEACQADCYYQQTTKCITETILANDYDFTVDGEIY